MWNPDSRVLAPPTCPRSEGTKDHPVACGNAQSVEMDYRMEMAGGCRAEPPVDAFDPGNQSCKERSGLVNRRDDHLLDSAQGLKRHPLSTEHSTGFPA